jgi:outer membrane immunogenic protein
MARPKKGRQHSSAIDDAPALIVRVRSGIGKLGCVASPQQPSGFPAATSISSLGLGAVMKRLVLGCLALAAMISGPAIAADMPVKARPVVANPVYDWSGFYLGGGTGGVWTRTERFMFDLPIVGLPQQAFPAHSSDWIYNFHAGVQGQWGRWVIGLEGAYNGTHRDMRTNVSVSPPEPFTTLSATTLVTDLVTIGPRVGYTWDRLMVYGTGGYAGAHVNGLYTCTGTDFFIFPGRAPCNFPLFGPLADMNFGGKTWNNGWFIGIGFDYVVYAGTLGDVLLGAEYQHFDLDSKTAIKCNAVNCPGLQHQSFSHSASGDIARVRLSFKTKGWGIR